jgi:hypothetical protein
MTAVDIPAPMIWKMKPKVENPRFKWMTIEFSRRRKLILEPIAVIALPIRLRINMANTALVNIVTALLTAPPDPDTVAKTGTLTLVVQSLMESGMLKLERPGEVSISLRLRYLGLQ